MARSDHLIDLVKAGVQGDVDSARKTAEAIAAEERGKKHSGVADRIARVLEFADQHRPTGDSGQARPRLRDGSGGILRQEARRSFSDLYLDAPVLNACQELVEEQRRADLLRAHGLEPRHRVLLVGPPGNGKTSLAEGLAYEMALPLFTVRYEAVVTSYLGETAQRLKRLFDYVRTEPCVLFFDEFDAIGKERGDIHETGEIKRLVTTLLLQLDDLPSYCVVVGATNHPELLDRATWRRFELRLEIAKPGRNLLIRYFSDQLDKFDQNSGFTATRLYEAIKPTSFSEAENFFLDTRRRYVLDQGKRKLRTVFDERVRAWGSRMTNLGEEQQNGRASDSETA
ncbi:ATP-binding protein [Hyphomonas sp.]|uniref:AAA family ATPase n=1 Tax=Hyphomonas sp. TaxID=87 RepID=UPI0025C15A50|nr:ATP-binding protein [Hyphomonas sp.]